MSSHRKTRGRHRAPVQHGWRSAGVATTAVLGCGVIALGTAGALHSTGSATPPLAALVASGTATAPLTAAVAPAALTDGLPARHGSDGAASGRASRGTARPALPARPATVRPSAGVLTSCFCPRWGTFHYGIDLAAAWGTPIYAAADGIVVQAGPAAGFGNLIVLRHDAMTETAYGHEEKILVKVGQRVRAGQVIALEGSRGYSTGPHLHFEVHLNKVPIDPVPWLARRNVRI